MNRGHTSLSLFVLVIIASITAALAGCKPRSEGTSSELLDATDSSTKVVLYVSGGFSSCDGNYMDGWKQHLQATIASLTGEQPATVTGCFNNSQRQLLARYYAEMYHLVSDGARSYRMDIRSDFSQDADLMIQRMGSGIQNRIYVIAGHSYGGTAAGKVSAQILARDPGAKVVTLTIDPIDPKTCAAGGVVFTNSAFGQGCKGTPSALSGGIAQSILQRGAGWVHVYQTSFFRLHSGPLFPGGYDAQKNSQEHIPYPAGTASLNAHTWIWELHQPANQGYMLRFRNLIMEAVVQS